jgi:hypothetical protein
LAGWFVSQMAATGSEKDDEFISFAKAREETEQRRLAKQAEKKARKKKSKPS